MDSERDSNSEERRRQLRQLSVVICSHTFWSIVLTHIATKRHRHAIVEWDSNSERGKPTSAPASPTGSMPHDEFKTS